MLRPKGLCARQEQHSATPATSSTAVVRGGLRACWGLCGALRDHPRPLHREELSQTSGIGLALLSHEGLTPAVGMASELPLMTTWSHFYFFFSHCSVSLKDRDLKGLLKGLAQSLLNK